MGPVDVLWSNTVGSGTLGLVRAQTEKPLAYLVHALLFARGFGKLLTHVALTRMPGGDRQVSTSGQASSR